MEIRRNSILLGSCPITNNRGEFINSIFVFLEKDWRRTSLMSSVTTYSRQWSGHAVHENNGNSL